MSRLLRRILAGLLCLVALPLAAMPIPSADGDATTVDGAPRTEEQPMLFNAPAEDDSRDYEAGGKDLPGEHGLRPAADFDSSSQRDAEAAFRASMRTLVDNPEPNLGGGPFGRAPRGNRGSLRTDDPFAPDLREGDALSEGAANLATRFFQPQAHGAGLVTFTLGGYGEFSLFASPDRSLITVGMHDVGIFIDLYGSPSSGATGMQGLGTGFAGGGGSWHSGPGGGGGHQAGGAGGTDQTRNLVGEVVQRLLDALLHPLVLLAVLVIATLRGVTYFASRRR